MRPVQGLYGPVRQGRLPHPGEGEDIRGHEGFSEQHRRLRPAGGLRGQLRLSQGYCRPALPPVSGDTMDMDSEKWLGLGFDDILRYRFQLVRSKSVIDIDSAREPSGILERVQEMALSARRAPSPSWRS